MSVPKYKRSKSKLEVVEDAKRLVKHTIQITNNENIFTPTYKALTQDIVRSAEKIFINSFTANNILAKTRKSADKRIELENDSILECNTLLALIDLSYSCFHLRAKKVEYWANLTITLRAKLKAWRDSEVIRYQSLT